MPTTFILKFSPHKTFHLTSFIFSTFYVSSLFIMYSHHHTHLHATLSIIFCIILPPILYSLSFKSISCHLLRFLPTQNHTSLHITSPHTFLTYCTSFIFTLHHLIHCITSSIALPHKFCNTAYPHSIAYLLHFIIFFKDCLAYACVYFHPTGSPRASRSMSSTFLRACSFQSLTFDEDFNHKQRSLMCPSRS